MDDNLWVGRNGPGVAFRSRTDGEENFGSKNQLYWEHFDGQPRSRVRNVSGRGLCASPAKNSTQVWLPILRFATKNRTRENS